MSLLNIVNENDNDININCDKPAYIRGIDGREVTVVKVDVVGGYNQVVSPENYSFEDALADAADGMIKLQYIGMEYQLAMYSDTAIVFTNIDGSTSTSVIWDKYNNSDRIIVRSVGLENVSHRVNSITRDSSNTQYPSAKAVYNLVTSYPGTVGPQGPQGPQGRPGSDGVDGEDGAPGADGKSAYQIAVDNGYTGTEAQFAELLMSAADKLDKPSVPGTEGQVLTADGEGGQAWQTPAGGSDELAQMIGLLATGFITDDIAGATYAKRLFMVDEESAQQTYDDYFLYDLDANLCLAFIPSENVTITITATYDYSEFVDLNLEVGKIYIFIHEGGAEDCRPKVFSTGYDMLNEYFRG